MLTLTTITVHKKKQVNYDCCGSYKHDVSALRGVDHDQHKLDDLVGDLGLTKENAEVMTSRLKECKTSM